LNKKEKKVNIIIINQIDENRNNNQNTNQNIIRRDKCDICGCRHGGECMIKKGIISKDWQDSDKARKRLQDKINQYKKNKIKLDNSTINENKARKDKSILLIISTIFFNQY
jgi:hypothetical protein